MELSGLRQRNHRDVLTMAAGYVVVKMGLFRSEESRVISNMVVYICSPMCDCQFLSD